jgi:uncharacterized lipoprotein YajG
MAKSKKKMMKIFAICVALISITGCTNNVSKQTTNQDANQTTIESNDQNVNNGNSVTVPSCH